jgi:RNA polymerase sigma-70 factor (ECF subfamily)
MSIDAGAGRDSSLPTEPGTGVAITTEEPEQRLAAALAGDQRAFAALVGPHRGAIQLHCYRMLGSFHDAEEATQETLLRAWRALSTYEARAPLEHWLYRIATTTCLMMFRAASRRPRTVDEVSHLEPYPDRLLESLPDSSVDPARETEHRESVALAFIAALQLLPATQRAAIVLKDVLGFSSAEIAETLDSTVASVNSSLQRGRARLRDTSPSPSPHGLSATDYEVLDRFVRAWHRRDIDGLVAVLAHDAVLRMPPDPGTFDGPQAIVGFLSSVPTDGRLDLIPLLVTRANGQPALAAYGPDPDGQVTAYGVMALELARGQVGSITGFADAGLFDAFGLPVRLDDVAASRS